MPNISLKLPPGMVRPGTVYDARGRWYRGNLVRWYEGNLQGIGGWSPLRVTTPEEGEVDLAAPVRGMIAWADNVQQPVLAMGTPYALWAYRGGALYDISPADLAPGRADADRVTGRYGQGAYGFGAYGTGQSIGAAIEEATTWQLDTFGEWLVACSSADRRILLWDDPTGATVAAPLAGAPSQNRGVVVTPERFVVALGADGNDRKVAWSDQENPTVWAADSTNQAGDLVITSPGGIMAARKGSGETLIWTDVDLWRMRYIGGQLVYSITRVAGNCGAISRHSMVMVDGSAYWMGPGGFHTYDGFVRPIPCDVAEAVFEDLNRAQASKITGYSRSQFGEVTWHYPSAGSTECDRYVTLNYRQGYWVTGELERTSGTDSAVFGHPLAADARGGIYQHEISRGGYIDPNGAELVPYIESGPIEIGEGERVMDVHQIIPDVNTMGAVTASIYSSIQPVTLETLHGPFELSAPTPVRLTGRHIRLRIDGARPGWRVGTFKLDVTPGGYR